MFINYDADYEKIDIRVHKDYRAKLLLRFRTEEKQKKLLGEDNEFRSRIVSAMEKYLNDNWSVSLAWNGWRWREGLEGIVYATFKFQVQKDKPSKLPTEEEMKAVKNPDSMVKTLEWAYENALDDIQVQLDREETVRQAGRVAKYLAEKGQEQAAEEINYHERLRDLRQELRDATAKKAEEMVRETKEDGTHEFKEGVLDIGLKHWDKFYSSGPFGNTRAGLSEEEVFGEE